MTRWRIGLALMVTSSAITLTACGPGGKSRKPSGRMPAPPHDDSGHTWHHADDILFGITKIGMAPPYGPSGYQSDMPAFGKTLADPQIWDVLAYIKSRWSPRALEAQSRISKERGGSGT